MAGQARIPSLRMRGNLGFEAGNVRTGGSEASRSRLYGADISC